MPWICSFSLKFYIIFFLISVLGNIFIDFNYVNLYTWIIVIIYIICFYIGTLGGSLLSPYRLNLFSIEPFKLLKLILFFSVPSVLLGWYFIIGYYGDLSYIFFNAMTIRDETIGDGIQIIPTLVSYMSSFLFVGFPLSLCVYHHLKNKIAVLYAVIFAVFIILTDLQTFGRIGMLYTIFVLGAYYLFFKVNIPFRKLFVSVILLFIILMIPRYIRGGGTLEGVSDKYSNFLMFEIPSFFSPMISVFCYYFAGLYALNEFLKFDFENFAMGERNFASIINLVKRIFPDNDGGRLTIIADSVNVPFPTNIYTIIGEIYMDFGFGGIFILPIFFGATISLFFKYHGIFADALKLVFITWIFYSPIYNMFSFGAFLLAYIILFLLIIFSYERRINYHC